MKELLHKLFASSNRNKYSKDKYRLYILGKFRDLYHCDEALSGQEKTKILEYVNRISTTEFDELLIKLRNFSSKELISLKKQIVESK